jgi:hypothetical protein
MYGVRGQAGAPRGVLGRGVFVGGHRPCVGANIVAIYVWASWPARAHAPPCTLLAADHHNLI